ADEETGHVDRDVVVLAPEERRIGERLVVTEDVPGRLLTLTLGVDPVLHPDTLAVRAGIAGDVTCGPDVRVAGSQPVVDEHSPIDVQPRLFGEPDSGNHPDAHDDEVGGHGRAIVQHHGVFGDALDAP